MYANTNILLHSTIKILLHFEIQQILAILLLNNSVIYHYFIFFNLGELNFRFKLLIFIFLYTMDFENTVSYFF